MLRLSDPLETEISLILSGHEKLFEWAKRSARLLRWGREICLLFIGVTGTRKSFEQTYNLAMDIAKGCKGIPLGSIVGEHWRKTRFATPYLRNTLWENGYSVDTLETAINWSSVPECASAILKSIDEIDKNILAFSHLSHVYRDGASIYVTYIFPREETPEEMLNRWKAIKSAASQTILSYGGTITHQHGVGRDHLPYLGQEKGKIGMDTIKRIGELFDPQGILNPGALFH
jgi:alkyldihydroxyacetonephosphate synthase